MTLVRIGLIGVDTSHSVAFSELLNNPNHPYHVSGGRVVVAFPGGSPDFHLSYSRVEGFTQELRNKYEIKIVSSPEEVAEQCDAILLVSADGRIHLDQFQKVAPFAKPVFIDKPFALSSNDAAEIIRLSIEHSTPIMSCSALRFAEGITQTLEQCKDEEIIGCDVYGPMTLESTQPGLYWYGIHTAEMLFRVLGKECVSVQTYSNNDHHIVLGKWLDGRFGTIRGNRKGNNHFGALIHCRSTTRYVDIRSYQKPFYASLLERIITMFQTRNSYVDIEESKKVIRFIEAANESDLHQKPVIL